MNHRDQRRWICLLLLSACALLVLGTTASAESRDDLKARFKARYPALLAAKEAGKVGETFEGFVGIVEGTGEAGDDNGPRSVVDAENADRRELYKMIAEREKTTPEKVAAMDARRRFEREPAGRYLKGPDGAWKKKG